MKNRPNTPDLHIRQLASPDVKVPDHNLNALQALWAVDNPFDQKGTEKIFVEAIRQCTRYHYDKNDFYKKWLDNNHFHYENIMNVKDIEKIPLIHANFYKTHTVKTANEKDIVLHLTSSGTTGQKSQMFYDDWTIFASDKSADTQFNYYAGLVKNRLTSCCILTSRPPMLMSEHYARGK